MEQIIITRPNGNRAPMFNRRTATAITQAKQNWALNAEDTVNITVESPIFQQYEIGDQITVFGRDYTLNRLPAIKKNAANLLQYDLEFEGVQYDLLRVDYELSIETTGNTLQDIQADSLTGNLERFMQVLVANLNRVFPGKWALGTIPSDTETETKTFGESDNCLAVLQTLCGDKYFFDIVKTDGVYYINIKSVGSTLPYTFKYGRNLGLYQLSRQNVSSNDIITRLKVFGSSENITYKYRADRLCLPGKTKHTSYIEDEQAVAKYGIREGRKNFDSVKPHYTGEVTAVDAGNVLKFTDTNFPFDLMEMESDNETTKYLISGENAKIHFNTGNLAGYEFEVHAYNHTTHTFTLVKQTDDRGDVFPNPDTSAFQFAVGDEYKVLGIAYPDTITNAAENELQEVGTTYYNQVSQPKVQYGLAVARQYLESLFAGTDGVANPFAPGDYLHIVDDDIDVDKSVRIKSLTRNVMIPYEYTLTISDTVTTSITNRVVQELIDVDKVITINNLKDPARARANWRTSRELMNMVFDPDGHYYTDKIAPLSIDTLALSVGAKSMQFGLTNTVFQPNFGGNANVLTWKGGVLTHYTINEDAAVSWNMADGSASNLTSGTAYYIYAKCEKNGTAGTFILSTQTIKTDSDENYYHFWIGVLSSVDSDLNVRSLSLTYGFTMINGRFIKTGRVESADGTTYFDLDNSEIGGRIVFTRNGEEKTLEELGAESLENKNYINNTLPGILSGMSTQIDGKIECWYQTTDPANNWTTNEEKTKHVGDMWYNTETKVLKRYTSLFAWETVTDADAIAAQAAAANAQDTADGKRRVFTSTPYTPYDAGDLWVQGTTGDIMVCVQSRASGNYSTNDWAKASKYTGDEALNTFIQSSYNTTIADIYAQLDGVIETWFNSGVPTLENAPAVDWDTTAKKEEHLGDMYYDNESGIGYRFSKDGSTYMWAEIRDTGVAEALSKANQAQDTADGKRRVFTSTPYPPYDVGDLWASGVFLKVCKTAKASGGTYADSDWKLATNYTGDESLNDFIDGVFNDTVSALYDQLDGKVENFYTSSDPANNWTTFDEKNAHVGDLWFNTSANTLWRYIYSRYTGFGWSQITDATAVAAQQAASHAQDTADGKRRVFTSTPVPPYDVGDLWVQGESGDIMVCQTAKASGGTYSSSDWRVASKYTDDSALNQFIDSTYNPQITAFAEQIDGKIESWFQTSDPATSWTTDSDKAKHVGDTWFDSTNNALRFYLKTDINPLRSDMITSPFQIWKSSSMISFGSNTSVLESHVGDVQLLTTTKRVYIFKKKTVGGLTSYSWTRMSDINHEYIAAALLSNSNFISGSTVWVNEEPTTNVKNSIMIVGIAFYVCNTSSSTEYDASLWSYIGNYVYCWQQTYDQVAIDAMAAASQAKDTADGKRRVFVDTPYPPYDIGDLWVDGTDLRRCITSKASGASYNVNDWVVAVYYDNTQTTIDGGIVTSGTIQVAGDNQSILAGITGNGTTAASIRFWAGASFENRATAPYRVAQDGSVVMTKADITGNVNATSGSIGGFEIAEGRIGTTASYEENTGLSLINDLIRFRSKSGYLTRFASIGNLNVLGFKNVARFELVSTDPYLIGNALFVKCESGDGSLEHWYTQRATDIRGNQFGLGKIAMFEKGFIGKAYSDSITSYFGLTHKFHFTECTSTRLALYLPTSTQVNNIVNNAVVMFDLEIVCDSDMPNTIVLKAQDGSGTKIVRGRHMRFVSHYDWEVGTTYSFYEVAKAEFTEKELVAGDTLRLRYYNNKYYIIGNEYEFSNTY